jgi:hypothetical protein
MMIIILLLKTTDKNLIFNQSKNMAIEEMCTQNQKELITKLFEEWQNKQINTEYDKMISASFPFIPSESIQLLLFSAGYLACKNNK